MSAPLPDDNPWLAKLGRGAIYAFLSFILAVAVSMAVSLLLQALLLSSHPYGDIRPSLYWSQLGAIVILAPLIALPGLSYARGSPPSLRGLVLAACLAASLAALGTALLLGPFMGAMSIPLLPAWLAGGVAASIALARSAVTAHPLQYAKSSLVAGTVAGALPIAASILPSFFA